MAKEIIVLRVKAGPNGTDIDVSWLFWLTVAAGHEVPLPTGSISAWAGASAAENAAIQAGQVIEEAHEALWPAGTAAAAIKTEVVSAFAARQATVTAQVNPNQYYGIYFDSATGWSA